MGIADGPMWDAAIVGAGPAGAISALLLARRGWRVVLLEKSAWPRDKVCGGCVNAAAVRMLEEIGVDEVLRGGTTLNRFSLHVFHKWLNIPLPGGIAIDRTTFDQRLVAAAEREGVTFLPSSAATLDPANPQDEFRHLRVMNAAGSLSFHARVVLACDGIAGSMLRTEPWAKWNIARDAWFGVATLIDAPELVDSGIIGMHVGRGGYVGTVRLGPQQVHVAAALDPAACRTAGGPLQLVAEILGKRMGDAKFQGTGLLTRRRMKLGGHRVLAVGDACGYVEPFTGEGIAWAVRGARAVVGNLPMDARSWSSSVVTNWERRHAEAVRTHWCRGLRRLARWPAAARFGVTLGSIVPVIARGIGERVSGLPQLEGVVT
jgi:flavin-dependent dehydrogenase